MASQRLNFAHLYQSAKIYPILENTDLKTILQYLYSVVVKSRISYQADLHYKVKYNVYLSWETMWTFKIRYSMFEDYCIEQIDSYN